MSIICLCGTLAGCTTSVSVHQERSWSLNYQETVTISTEPSGARIYVQGEYVGQSPIDITLDCGGLKVVQSGERMAKYYTKVLSSAVDEENGFRGWKGDPDWNSSLRGETSGGNFSVKAYLDGFTEGVATITCGETNGYSRALGQLSVNSSGQLPSTVMGHSSIVIALRPEPILSQHTQQQQQQQQTVILPGGAESSQKVGRIIVQSSQQDCEISVDGMFVGNAPATLVLGVGVHVVEVKKSGFKAYRREVRVLGDTEVTLKVVLEK
jgi:hypothetical protein